MEKYFLKHVVKFCRDFFTEFPGGRVCQKDLYNFVYAKKIYAL